MTILQQSQGGRDEKGNFSSFDSIQCSGLCRRSAWAENASVVNPFAPFVPEPNESNFQAFQSGDPRSLATRFVFASGTSQVSNSDENTWVDLFSVSIGPSTRIMIWFSSEVALTYSTEGCAGQFHCLIDGTALAQDPFTSPDDNDFARYETFAFNWWATGLSATVHTVKIQYKPSYDGATMYCRDRTLTVAGMGA